MELFCGSIFFIGFAVVPLVVAIVALRRVSAVQRELHELRMRLPTAGEAARSQPAEAPAVEPFVPPAAEAAAAPQEPEPPPPPAPPPPPDIPIYQPPPAGPPFWQRVDWESLVGVKLFSWIAGVAMVFAAIYFLRYSVEHGWISPPVRAAMGLLTGALLIGVCELRVARPYRFTANAMHGAGVAILYATLFAMHALWHLVGAGVVFAGMLIVTAIAVALSIRRESLFIALLGMMGGFAAPALLSSGENRPIALFSYLLLLNVGLAWVANRKGWPALVIGSIAFSVMYQWAWVARYLDVAQVPLAAGIFVVFAIVAMSAMWWPRRDGADQRTFEGASQAGAALPLLFAMFAAAVPAYGARFHILFGFLFCMVAGLGVVAILRGVAWMHSAGVVATLVTFAVWLGASYTPSAWPDVLAWTGAFVVLLLAIGTRIPTSAAAAAGLLLFAFPVLARIEPRSARPGLFFSVLLILVILCAAYALRFRLALTYLSAHVLAVAAAALWSAEHLTSPRVWPAVVVYVLLGWIACVVSAWASRLEHSGLESSAAYAGLASYALLFFVSTSERLTTPPWPLLAAVALLSVATAGVALRRREGWLVAGGITLSQLVLLSWTAHMHTSAWANVAFFATLLVAAYGLACLVAAAQRVRLREYERLSGFRVAAAAALVLAHFVAIGAGDDRDPSLFWPLLLTHAIIAAATLALALYAHLPKLALWSVLLTAIATILAATEGPLRQLIFAGAIYAVYLTFPLAAGRRAGRRLEPYLSAVLAGIPFFFLAREAMLELRLRHIIGVLPLSQALAMLVLLAFLLRLERGGERLVSRLATVAAAALAFITVAVPLQLEKQWITIAWALEGAALVWLHRRIPDRGLLAWAAALLAAVFVRLTLNPAVLSYHPSTGRPILNWYLYAYLVCAIAFFVAARVAPRQYARSIGAAYAAGATLLFFLLNIEIADYYSTGRTLTFDFFSSPLAQELTYTIAWALFAILVLIAGIAFRSRGARVAAIALLVVTILKCFLHDLARLGGLYRIASFLGLALALVLVSVLLQKFVLARRDAGEDVSLETSRARSDTT